jgi:hypothetical protein
MNNFLRPHFKVKNMFERNVLKLVMKKKSSIVLLPFYSSMLKSFSIFKRNGAHLVEKKEVGEKRNVYS